MIGSVEVGIIGTLLIAIIVFGLIFWLERKGNG